MISVSEVIDIFSSEDMESMLTESRVWFRMNNNFIHSCT